MNVAIIQGRPTREPEMKDTRSGKVMCKVRLAVDRPYKKDTPKKTDYFDVLAFGKLGQNVFQNLGKGALCTVLGRMEQSEYEDYNGNRKESYCIVANRVSIHEWTKKRKTAHEELEEMSEADADLLIPREITKSLHKAIDFEDEDIPM